MSRSSYAASQLACWTASKHTYLVYTSYKLRSRPGVLYLDFSIIVIWNNCVFKMVKTRNPPKERKAGDLKRKASSASISLEDPESLSPLAEAVRRVSPFVSITPTPPPSRGGNGGPSPRKRILVEDRLEVRPVASTSKLVQHHHHLQPVHSTSKEPKGLAIWERNEFE